jgi:hypothetical protein
LFDTDLLYFRAESKYLDEKEEKNCFYGREVRERKAAAAAAATTKDSKERTKKKSRQSV